MYALLLYDITQLDTGAGDAFIGALAAFLARGATVEAAVTAAVAVASVSVCRRGAQSSYPTASELPDSVALPPLSS
jgi:sugar/nucleoside kinase (ribokinase family)